MEPDLPGQPARIKNLNLVIVMFTCLVIIATIMYAVISMVQITRDERLNYQDAVPGYPEIRDSLVSMYRLSIRKATILSFHIGFNCDRYGVPWREAAAFIQPESNFDPYAVSDSGALGYYQIMPETGIYLAQQMNEPYPSDYCLFNPELNIRLGIYYIAKLKLAMDGSYEKAARCYFVGIGNFYQGRGREKADKYWGLIRAEYRRFCGTK